MKTKNIFFIVTFIILCSCNPKKVEIFPLDTITYTSASTKIEYFEIDNFDYLNDKELLNKIISFNNKNINIDSVVKYDHYYRYFYERHFYLNYLKKYDRYYMDDERTTFEGMNNYLLSFIRYSKINNNKIDNVFILYKNSLIALEINDTINLKN